MLGIKGIIKAKERIDNYVIETPIISSSLLNQWMGHEIFFKAEGFQKIGAFKARGGCNAISWLIENQKKPKKIVANSSGNHSQSIAWSAKQFNIPATIYMPDYSSEIKIQATKSYGAEVILCKTRDIADQKVKEASEEDNVFWIPPFNHEQVISGQGTSAYEALHQVSDIDAVFAPCGGGGLLSGTLISTHSLSVKSKVFGVEPLNGNDATQSFRTGTIQKLTHAPKTLADGAMTLAVGNITFEYLKKLDDMFEVEESKIIYWTQWLSHLLKLQIEPTSAMAMEATYQWLSKQKSKKRILIILSGANIDQKTRSTIWEENYLNEVPKI